MSSSTSKIDAEDIIEISQITNVNLMSPNSSVLISL
jgi:hypothetical protein